MNRANRDVVSDASGSVYVEYLILLVLLGVAFVALVGPDLTPTIVDTYQTRRELLYLPNP